MSKYLQNTENHEKDFNNPSGIGMNPPPGVFDIRSPPTL
jgi:hypothetical protein